jgi:hypothetical protein
MNFVPLHVHPRGNTVQQWTFTLDRAMAKAENWYSKGLMLKDKYTVSFSYYIALNGGMIS